MTDDLRTLIAKAIVQADERNGGPCWDLLITMGKHVVPGVWECADEVLGVLAALDAAEARADSPLSAVAMRRTAAQMAGFIALDVPSDDYVQSRNDVVALILGLPMPAPAELLAAAAELAEVKALVDAACVIRYRRENGCSGSVNSAAAVDALIEALAPFARKTGV